MTAANRILRSYGESITVGTAEGRGFISALMRTMRRSTRLILRPELRTTQNTGL